MLSKGSLSSGNQSILVAGFQGQVLTLQGPLAVWMFEAVNVPSTGVQLTRAISESQDWTLLCRSLSLSTSATCTIFANGGQWATFTGRSFDFGANGLFLNPLNSFQVTHTATQPIALITLVALPVLIASRTTWI